MEKLTRVQGFLRHFLWKDIMAKVFFLQKYFLNFKDYKVSFPLRAWNEEFFVCFIDFLASLSASLDLTRGKIKKRNRECSIPRSLWKRILTMMMMMMMMMIFYSRLVTIFKYMQCTLSKA